MSSTLGRFHDGRLYLANLDGTICRRVDLPDTLSIPPYDFQLFLPEVAEAAAPSKGGLLGTVAGKIQALFGKSGESPPAKNETGEGSIIGGPLA